MARRDADGFIYIVDRSKDMIISGGFNVFPREVEDVLTQHPAVASAAVIGVPDEQDLVKPKAFVVLKPGVAAHDGLADLLKAHVKSKLAPYKYPRWIEFVESLPRGPGGKLLRYKLRPMRRRRRAETGSLPIVPKKT